MNVTAPTIDRMSNIYNNSVVRYWHFLFNDLAGKLTLHSKRILIIGLTKRYIKRYITIHSGLLSSHSARNISETLMQSWCNVVMFQKYYVPSGLHVLLYRNYDFLYFIIL